MHRQPSHVGSASAQKFATVTTHLQLVSSLKLPSSSSEALLLTVRLAFLDSARELAAEAALELAPEATRERALRDMVLVLPRTWRRRSLSGMVGGLETVAAEYGSGDWQDEGVGSGVMRGASPWWWCRLLTV